MKKYIKVGGCFPGKALPYRHKNRGTAGQNNKVMSISKVRAKVKVHEITELTGYDSKAAKSVPAKRFKMQIVGYAGQESDENKFYAHISGGTNIELQTINPEVFPFFEVGKDYYVDFLPSI